MSRLLELMTHPKMFYDALKTRIFKKPKEIEWNSRVNELGAYSVIDTRHAPSEYEYVTKRQKEILFPLLKSQLSGLEKTVLDFGCGPGRFTQDLAEIIKGKAVGTDVTEKLIKLTVPHPDVKFIYAKNFFAENNLKFDIVWVSLVLGGIPDKNLRPILDGIVDSLSPNGLLFLVESTGDEPVEEIWRIRTRDQLCSLFPSIALQTLGTYYDVGQEISILAGRKIEN